MTVDIINLRNGGPRAQVSLKDPLPKAHRIILKGYRSLITEVLTSDQGWKLMKSMEFDTYMSSSDNSDKPRED